MHKLKQLFTAGVVTTAIVSASASQAAGAIDLTAITGAFTAADVVAGILAIGAVLATIYATSKAASMVLGMIRGR